MFHRVRHSVEHSVERLFFHEWHANEAQLRHFVREAGYILSVDNLLQSFCVELARFSGGAAVAVYVADPGAGVFRRAGAVDDMAHSETLDIDDPLFLAMQAKRAHVAVDDTRSLLSYVDGFPFFHRGSLLGVVLIGTKPNGDIYRPDESAVMAWAAHQIGLDHQALMLVRLEQMAGKLSRQLATHDAELATWREQVAFMREAISAKGI